VTNKIFLKISLLIVLSVLSYLLFVVFFLSPKVSNYLIQTEIRNTKSHFDKFIKIVNNKSTEIQDKDILTKELESMLETFALGDFGHVYLISDSGKIIFDPSGEFRNQEELQVVLSNGKKLFDEIKNSYKKNEPLQYNWNRVDDLNNFKYKKISWVDYNQFLNVYIVSSIYEEEFLSSTDGINLLILETSIFLFSALILIGIFITLKIIVPINKIIQEIQNANLIPNNPEKVKNKLSFLTSQINTLVHQAKNNSEAIEEQIQIKTKEIESRLYYDDLTNLKNRYALEDDIKNNDFISIALLDIDSFDDINELYGFSIGNTVLIKVANVLTEFASKYDVTVYRIYGNVYGLCDHRMMGFTKYGEFIQELGNVFKYSSIYVEELDIDIYINITLGISIAQEEKEKEKEKEKQEIQEIQKKVPAANRSYNLTTDIPKSRQTTTEFAFRDILDRVLNKEPSVISEKEILNIVDMYYYGDTEDYCGEEEDKKRKRNTISKTKTTSEQKERAAKNTIKNSVITVLEELKIITGENIYLKPRCNSTHNREFILIKFKDSNWKMNAKTKHDTISSLIGGISNMDNISDENKELANFIIDFIG
jgi:diguanylate cyclase (GGDEF)-like protein